MSRLILFYQGNLGLVVDVVSNPIQGVAASHQIATRNFFLAVWSVCGFKIVCWFDISSKPQVCSLGWAKLL